MSSSTASSLLSQPARPENHYREFTAIDRLSNLTTNNSTNNSTDDDDVCFSTFCSKCEPIREWYSENVDEVLAWTALHGDQELKHVIQHYPTVEELVISSRQSCHMCTTIVESLLVPKRNAQSYTGGGDRMGALLAQYGASGPVTILIHIKPKFYNRTSSLYANLIPRVPKLEGLFTGATISSVLTSRASIPYHTWGKGMPLSTNSSLSFRLIKEWLDRCINTHQACGTSAAVSSPPTRLLFIFYDGPVTKFRLVETETITAGTDIRYVALSYCWGGSSTVKLTTDSEDVLVRGLDACCLPRTIQDAISVTLKLGLSWIWVDSLCIIQDSIEDWTREAASMCKVYLGCFLCIAARGAANSDEGLFALRDPLRQSPCIIVDKAVTRDGDHMYVTAWYHLRASLPWPLEARGWALQERALPPRMVKFGSYVCWECRECAADEFGLETRSGAFQALPGAYEHIIREFYDTILGKRLQNGAMDSRAPFTMWQTLVEEYSTTSLSFITDRYAAINGLVTAMQQSLGWKPKWGLWQDYMLDGLCWSVIAESAASRTGFGPTWSWLSIDGPVGYFGSHERNHLAVVLPEQSSEDLDGLPTDLHGKAIKITARPLHIQGVMDSHVGYDQPVEWARVEELAGTKKIHWRLDLRNPQAYRMADCLILPLRALQHSLMMDGLLVTPSPVLESVFERCGDWEASWDKEDPGSIDEYRTALDVTMSLPQQAVMLI